MPNLETKAPPFSNLDNFCQQFGTPDLYLDFSKHMLALFLLLSKIKTYFIYLLPLFFFSSLALLRDSLWTVKPTTLM